MVGVHDMLYAPCSQEMFELQHGVTGPHPNCFDNLAERDVIVAVTSCAAPGANAGGARPIRVDIGG